MWFGSDLTIWVWCGTTTLECNINIQQTLSLKCTAFKTLDDPEW